MIGRLAIPQRPARAPEWLSIWSPKPDAPVRLLCLPFAGAGASYYHPWSRALGAAPIELAAVQLPGREARFHEPPFRRMAPLIHAMSAAVKPALDRPYCLFGHSLGAFVAFELACALRDQGLPEPSHLFVSGAPAPPRLEQLEPIGELPDAEFIRVMSERYEGIPREVLENRELLAMVLPALRADMEIVETYSYQPRAPLTCEISALGGDSDPYAGAGALESWRAMTTGSTRVDHFPGGHFYLTGARNELVRILQTRLAKLCG